MIVFDQLPDRWQRLVKGFVYTVPGAVGMVLLIAVSSGEWPDTVLQWAGSVAVVYVVLLAVVWFHVTDRFTPPMQARIGIVTATLIAVGGSVEFVTQGSVPSLLGAVFFLVLAAAGVWMDLRHGWGETA